MEYGSVIGEAQQDTTLKRKIEVDNIQDIFVQYFDNPTLKKVGEDDFSIYMSCIKCMIIGTCRYIIVNIPRDGLPEGTQRKLSDITNWSMIQTRTLEGKFDASNHTYLPKTDKIFESTLSIVKRTKKYSEYSCENIPVKVTVFHKKDLQYEYPNNGNLNSAIEIYNTVITRI